MVRIGPYSISMGVHVGKIRSTPKVLFGLSMLLLTSVCSAPAQTPSPSQPAPSSTAQRPLPDLNTLIQQAEAQQRASWKTIRQYTYHSLNTEQDFDSHGNAKNKSSIEIETICVDVGCFIKAVARDGKPLSDDAMKRQNQNIDNEIAWIKDRNQKIAAGQPPPPPPKKKKSEDISDANLAYANFLTSFLQMGPQLGAFSNLRRVQLNGRDTIAIDYQGNPHAKSHTMLDGIFRNLAGTVWVDVRDHALVRVEGHVFEDYKVGGGLLADVHKGATVQMEWTKVNGEVWLPAMFNGRGSARIALFAYHSAELDQHWTDYRKFRASSTILPGVAEAPDNHDTSGSTQPQP